MSASHPLTVLAIIASVLMPSACYALDDICAPHISRAPRTGLRLCGTDGARGASADACKDMWISMR